MFNIHTQVLFGALSMALVTMGPADFASAEKRLPARSAQMRTVLQANTAPSAPVARQTTKRAPAKTETRRTARDNARKAKASAKKATPKTATQRRRATAPKAAPAAMPRKATVPQAAPRKTPSVTSTVRNPSIVKSVSQKAQPTKQAAPRTQTLDKSMPRKSAGRPAAAPRTKTAISAMPRRPAQAPAAARTAERYPQRFDSKAAPTQMNLGGTLANQERYKNLREQEAAQKIDPIQTGQTDGLTMPTKGNGLSDRAILGQDLNVAAPADIAPPALPGEHKFDAIDGIGGGYGPKAPGTGADDAWAKIAPKEGGSLLDHGPIGHETPDLPSSPGGGSGDKPSHATPEEMTGQKKGVSGVVPIVFSDKEGVKKPGGAVAKEFEGTMWETGAKNLNTVSYPGSPTAEQWEKIEAGDEAPETSGENGTENWTEEDWTEAADKVHKAVEYSKDTGLDPPESIEHKGVVIYGKGSVFSKKTADAGGAAPEGNTPAPPATDDQVDPEIGTGPGSIEGFETEYEIWLYSKRNGDIDWGDETGSSGSAEDVDGSYEHLISQPVDDSMKPDASWARPYNPDSGDIDPAPED